jgi:hypothetical protein
VSTIERLYCMCVLFQSLVYFSLFITDAAPFKLEMSKLDVATGYEMAITQEIIH